jgi:ornithine decarboxylase
VVVLIGPAASNKIVLQGLLAQGGHVLFDRNNHKAAHHGALYLGETIPVFVETDRNIQVITCSIDHGTLDENSIREKTCIRPLVTDPEAWCKLRPFQTAVIEQCTYDGTIYSAETILRKLGPLCDHILFDEARVGVMKFLPIYRARFAIGLQGLRPDAPGVESSKAFTLPGRISVSPATAA